MNDGHPTRCGDWYFESRSEADTQQLGQCLGRVVGPGCVIALNGSLGAGKTRLVQSIAEEMGADRKTVNSPTFILIQEYAGKFPIYHADTYRLRDSDEFLELGVEELFDAGGVCLIEWADRVADVLPQDHLRVDIEITGTESRRFVFHGAGPLSATLLSQLRTAMELTDSQ